MDKPVIAITMGDAAGIGPELIVKTLSVGTVWDSCSPFVVGDPGVMRDICKVVGANLRFKAVERLSEASFSPPGIDVLRPEGLHIDCVPWGRVDPAMGRTAALCLRTAFGMAMEGEVQGVVSAPLNKEALHLAGYQYTDDLAYLADLTNSQEAFMLGAILAIADSIWTITVTGHVPFRDVVDLIKKDRILWRIGKMNDVLKKVGFAEPRIAVAALNAHAGGGLFGREEIDEIEPAIQEARAQGINVEGPVPADMVFVRALAGVFDGIVCMYHDQANIARKLQPKRKGATIYMGLPVICGTTAHGTAFDKAGKGIADPGVPLARKVRDSIEQYVDQYHEIPKVVLMQNHGLITLGRTAQQVENITAMAVKAARVLIGAYALGEPRFLTAENVDRIHTRPDKAYRRKVSG